MTLHDRALQLAHDARRVVQTPATFSNWPALLTGLAAERAGSGSAELEFSLRNGLTMTCPNVPGARLAVYEQFAEDCYDLAGFLAPLAGSEVGVLDIGAHIGSFSLHVAQRLPLARIISFEPSPQTARYLRGNVTRNGLDERITVREAALAAAEGTAQLDDNDGASVHNGLVQDDARLVAGDDARDRRRTLEVATTTFDLAVAALTEEGVPPRLVKLDCEGGEYPMVYASSPDSWASVTHVVMEYHPVEGESWPTLRGWLADAGLEVVRDEPGRPGLGTAWLTRR